VRYDGRAFGDDAKLSVQLDTQTIFNNIVIGDLSREELFNGRFAFFGFTASTSWTETSQIDITSWKTVLVPSDTAVKEFSTEAIARFEFGTVANFTILKRDSCTNIIPFGSNATILAKLSQQVPSDADAEDFPKLDGNITDNGDGTLTASFQLPESVQGLWDLDIQANGVRSEGMPWIGGVESFKPAPQGSGLPIWALILLLLLILLIILVLSYVVYRLHRYRKKLQKNAEFIEAGKKQAELDRLEDGTSYVANPMVGTIDDLKTQLGKNEEELERLRKRGALGEDQNFTIEQLQKQRDALLEEMNRLKREEQEEELKKSKGTSDFVAGGRAKKEFGREQI
jgi:cell division protein FtsL